MAKNFPLGEVPADAMLINKKEDGSSGAINSNMPSASVRASAGGDGGPMRSDWSRFPNLENPEEMSDREYLDFEFSFGLQLALDSVLKSDTWKTELRGKDLQELTKRETQFATDLKSKQKICLHGCNNLAQNNNHWCRDCGADLPTMPEVELSKSITSGLKPTPISGASFLLELIYN